MVDMHHLRGRRSICVCGYITVLVALAAVASAAERDWREDWFEFIDKGDVSALREMIENDADVNAKDRRGQTGLIIASSKGDDQVVELLLKAGAGVEASGMYGVTPLMSAIQRGHDGIAEKLMAAGADIDTKDMWLMTPLAYAMRNDATNMVEFLLDKGANPDGKLIDGVPLIIRACQRSSEMVRLMMEHGADIHASDSNSGDTLLMSASQRGDAGLVDTLLEQGADPNAANKKGYTALMCAARYGHADTLKRLIRAGANVNARTTEYGETALLLAAGQGRVETVKVLLKAGADVNATEMFFCSTPLLQAEMREHKETAELLRAAGGRGADTVKKKDVTPEVARVANRELVILQSAVEQWELERRARKGDPGPTFEQASAYMSHHSSVYARKGLDLLGNPFQINQVGVPASFSPETLKVFEEKNCLIDTNAQGAESEDAGLFVKKEDVTPDIIKQAYDDLRIIRAAIENEVMGKYMKKGDPGPSIDVIREYIRSETPLYKRKCLDVLGNPFQIHEVGIPASLSPETLKVFEEVQNRE